jgi:hypothetical protein
VRLIQKYGKGAVKAILLSSLCFSVCAALQGCKGSASTATDDAALRKEFKRPRSINDVPPDKRAMVEGILRAQREGRAPKAPVASAPK